MNAVLNFEEESIQEPVIKQPLNIYQRLNAVMLDVQYIQKLDKTVNGQYRFVSHDQVIGVLHGPITKHGIAVIPSVLEHEKQGTTTTLKIQVSFVNIDNPNDRVDTIYFGYGVDGGDKGIGKAISYAVKYAMLKTFCLETGDDPDYTPSITPEKAEKDAVSVAEIQKFFESTSDQANAEKYVSFLASESNKSYLDVVVRAMKNKDAFEKNLNRWKKNQ
jgi:hypothetical protein